MCKIFEKADRVGANPTYLDDRLYRYFCNSFSTLASP